MIEYSKINIKVIDAQLKNWKPLLKIEEEQL